MSKEITNVYVPVTTPDHKKWALLLALLIHSGILGFIIYTNHPKNLDEPVMQTTLVTPEQLTAIQGQIAANQNNHASNTGDSINPDGKTATAPSMSDFLAGGSQSNMPAPNPIPRTSTEAQALADDLAQRQAAFEKDRDTVAASLDKEGKAELQDVAESIDQQLQDDKQKVIEYKTSANNVDSETEALRKEAQAATNALRAKSNALTASQATGNKNFSLKADLNANTGAGQSQGGNGTARLGSSKGGDVASYRNIVQSTINNNWNPPPNAKNGTSQTAYFDISTSGTISNVRVDGSDSPLKTSLIQAINSASLPPPPPEVASRFASNTMRFVVGNQ